MSGLRKARWLLLWRIEASQHAEKREPQKVTSFAMPVTIPAELAIALYTLAVVMVRISSNSDSRLLESTIAEALEV